MQSSSPLPRFPRIRPGGVPVPASAAPPVQTTNPTTLGSSPRPKPSTTDNQNRNGRFGPLNAFVESSMAGLGRAEIAVWIVLFRAFSTKEGKARCSNTYIAERTGLAERSVTRALTRLQALGLVTRLHGGFPGAISEYTISGVVVAGTDTGDGIR